jgi:hypothetical protein
MLTYFEWGDDCGWLKEIESPENDSLKDSRRAKLADLISIGDMRIALSSLKKKMARITQMRA